MGFLSLSAGVIGIVLPLLPTTPFILLAAYFFAKSSKRLYNFLLTHKIFGPIIIDYSQKKAISIKTKIYAVSLMWVFLLPTIILFINFIWIKIMVAIIGLAVTFYLVKFPTLKEE